MCVVLSIFLGLLIVTRYATLLTLFYHWSVYHT